MTTFSPGTVQKQYTSGHYKIAQWASITNAHILPGPAIVTALKAAAAATIAKYNTAVHTEISASPKLASHGLEDVPEGSENSSEHEHAVDDSYESAELVTDRKKESRTSGSGAHDRNRKASVVSISTTISRRTESISPHPAPELLLHGGSSHGGSGSADDSPEAQLARLGEPPYLRSLLLLAEMSSEGHLLTGDYTQKCVDIARENRDFVMGFIAQRSLNSEDGDNFVTMTPGVQLPPADNPGAKLGDGLGQQYNSPHNIVYEKGCDVIIVGRGIVNARDRLAEAERYRREGWAAYEKRVGIQ